MVVGIVDIDNESRLISELKYFRKGCIENRKARRWRDSGIVLALSVVQPPSFPHYTKCSFSLFNLFIKI